MKQKLLFIAILTCLFGTHFLQAQQFILFTENFEAGFSLFTINSGGPATGIGSNKWVINNNYTGTPTYDNTLSQDSTLSGTIGSAPSSTYLHIHDEPTRLGGGVSNANYNGTVSSDQFAFISSGFCTLGMSDIIFTFFWLGEGDPNAYGEVYYSINNGPWINYGTRFQNQRRWKYEVLTHPDWTDKQDIRIGFRWQNATGSSTRVSSWGLDDFVAVGTYDTTRHAVRMTLPSVFPNPVCQLSFLFINWNLSDSLCFGEYRIELSNSSGTFAATPTSLGTFYIGSGDTSGTIPVQIPGTVAPGLCYRVRITRLNPGPVITSAASACFEVRDCPNTITTLVPIVLTDRDTACVRSAIDIPFFSVGVFNAGNTYIAEISDTNGSFAAPLTVGTFPSTNTFDPALGSPPGNVSGLIPIVPEGCGYYIRIRGTNPPTIGTRYGPFCLKHCDITTNLTRDLQFCISDTPGGGDCDSIQYQVNSFDSLVDYYRGNNFRLQIIDKKTFNIINDGNFYFHFDTVSRKLIICIPHLDSLRIRGLSPGSYYARFVADSSSDTDNVNGTIIRFTIGAPASNPPEIFADDTVGCNVGVLSFFIVPYNSQSQYEWASNGINGGTPFIWPFNPLRVDFTGAAVSTYQFYVREINNGCYGPLSDPARVYIISTPPVTITGPDEACLGDTVCFEVPFIKETYYEWNVVGGKIIDASNNQMCVAFDSIGEMSVSIYALNECGTNRNTKKVTVKKLLDLNMGADKTVCSGDSVKISAQNNGVDKTLTTILNGTGSTKGNMFNVKPIYDLTLVDIECVFQSTASADVQVYMREGSFVGFETDPTAWTMLINYTGLVPTAGGVPTKIPIPLYQNLDAGKTYAFYITTTNSANFLNSNGTTVGALYKSDGVLEFYEGTKNVYPFGAFLSPFIWNGKLNYNTKGSLKFQWSNGDSLESIWVKPFIDTRYEVRVFDTSGCGTNGIINVSVLPLPFVDAGPDTSICTQKVYTMNASSTSSQFQWTPSNGLSSATILNPTVTLTQAQLYYLSVLDPATGCKAADSVRISLKDCEDPFKVPDAFSPNGDGVNDFFSIFADGITNYQIRIFNRWGELVYFSEDESELNSLSKGWNGTLKNKEQSLGVYVYWITGTDKESITRERKGNITLIR